MLIKKYQNRGYVDISNGFSEKFIEFNDVKFIKGKTYLAICSFKVLPTEYENQSNGKISSKFNTSVYSSTTKSSNLKNDYATELLTIKDTFVAELGDGISDFIFDFTVYNDFGEIIKISDATLTIEQLD